VEISRSAQKDLRQVPKHIAVKLQAWVDEVRRVGVEEVRKIPGYHDEPLHGDRKGQRSIRLSRGYRAIYRVLEDGKIEFILIEEVNKHAY
jgi:proteic killer suppression protein